MVNRGVLAAVAFADDVIVLTLTGIVKSGLRGHRNGSSHSGGVEEYPRLDKKKKKLRQCTCVHAMRS